MFLKRCLFMVFINGVCLCCLFVLFTYLFISVLFQICKPVV